MASILTTIADGRSTDGCLPPAGCGGRRAGTDLSEDDGLPAGDVAEALPASAPGLGGPTAEASPALAAASVAREATGDIALTGSPRLFPSHQGEPLYRQPSLSSLRFGFGPYDDGMASVSGGGPSHFLKEAARRGT